MIRGIIRFIVNGIVRSPIGFGDSGGVLPPPIPPDTFSQSLDFSDNRNSQFVIAPTPMRV